MGDPVTWLAVGGMVLSAGGGILQAKAALDQAEAEKDAADYNADLARKQATAEAERRYRYKRRKLSSQRVAYAKAGVLLEGSPLAALEMNAAELEVDALNALWEGEQSAQLSKARGRQAKHRGQLQAGAALLSGATGAISSGFSTGVISMPT